MRNQEQQTTPVRLGVWIAVALGLVLAVMAIVGRSGRPAPEIAAAPHATKAVATASLSRGPVSPTHDPSAQQTLVSETTEDAVAASSAALALAAPQVKPEPSLAAPDTARASELSRAPGITQLLASLNAEASGLTAAQRGELIRQLVREMTGKTAAERLGLLEQVVSFRDRNQIAVQVTGDLFNSEIGAAIAWTRQLTDERLAKNSAAELGRRWSKQDLPSALQWAEGLEPSPLKTSATEGIIWSWAQTEPEAAYEWAAKTFDAASRDKSFVMISKILALQQPERAVQWAAQLPDSAVKREALTYSVYQWTLKDPSRASQWSAQIADEQTRERALLTVAEAWVTTNPGSMFQWSESIPDPVLRAKARAAGERVLSRRSPAP